MSAPGGTGAPAGLRDEVARRAEAILQSGMVPRHRLEDVMGLAALARARLTDAGDARRASTAAALVEDVIERSLAAHPPPQPVACRKGCSYCCHGYISATAPEIFLIAGRMRQAMVTAGTAVDSGAPQADVALASAVRHLLSGPAPGYPDRKRPCPLLAADACTIYDIRPLSCRHLASHSVEACIAALERDDVEIPVPANAGMIGQGCKLALIAAIKSVGLKDSIYELGSALRIAFAAPEGEQEWLAGRDVFAEAIADPYRPPQIERLIDTCVNAIR